MSNINDIIQEYVRMREHGLDVQEALRALKVYVEPLSVKQRQQLAQHLRKWETEKLTTSTNPVVGKVEKPKEAIPESPKNDFVWVECPNCAKKNRSVEVFCYSCGQMLQKVAGRFDTKHFMQATDDLYNDEYYGLDSILVLEVQDSEKAFEVRPQLKFGDLIIGRSSKDDKLALDVDLESANASQFGVSRTHLSLIYDNNTSTLQIHDLGSSNGTFINGQKIHPSERRALRHGDELRLGRLVFKITFIHPGQQL